VAVGADVIVAPTWQTHRRALLAVGETRQARAWTAAAIRLGREAVEIGLERRADVPAEDGADRADDDPAAPTAPTAPAAPAAPVLPPHLRPAPLLAASLPALEEIPEPGMGRLLPRQASGERDYRDQAGILADGAPDLLLVEGQSTITEARLAVEAALDTGLPVWVALSGIPDDTHASARLIDALGGRSVDCLLLPGDPSADPPSPPTTWGGLLDAEAPATGADTWLHAGARVLALLDGATPGRLGPIRSAIDRAEEAAHRAARDADERWWTHLRRAAAMAEGGAALWLLAPGEHAPRAEQLPSGFDWLVVARDDAHLLPDGRFRLAVGPALAGGSAEGYGRLLDDRGILAWTGDARPMGTARLRIVAMADARHPALAILRREP